MNMGQPDAADAIIFGSPTYMGTVSWQFKKFADASSKPWFSQKWKDKVGAAFTNSATMNGDKLSTLHYLFTLGMQHSMIWVGTGLMPANSKAAQRNDINFVGSFSGLMAQSPSDLAGRRPAAGRPGNRQAVRCARGGNGGQVQEVISISATQVVNKSRPRKGSAFSLRDAQQSGWAERIHAQLAAWARNAGRTCPARNPATAVHVA
jgi:multimeric flavodoxin WrbA